MKAILPILLALSVGACSLGHRSTLGSIDAAKMSANPAAWTSYPVALRGDVINASTSDGWTTFTLHVSGVDGQHSSYFHVVYPAETDVILEGGRGSMLGYLRPEKIQGLNAFGGPVTQAVMDAVAVGTIEVGYRCLQNSRPLCDAWEAGTLYEERDLRFTRAAPGTR